MYVAKSLGRRRLLTASQVHKQIIWLSTAEASDVRSLKKLRHHLADEVYLILVNRVAHSGIEPLGHFGP